MCRSDMATSSEKVCNTCIIFEDLIDHLPGRGRSDLPAGQRARPVAGFRGPDGGGEIGGIGQNVPQEILVDPEIRQRQTIAQRIEPVLGKGLAARVRFVATRIVEVLVGVALVGQLRSHLFVGEAIGRGLEAVVLELHIRGAGPHKVDLPGPTAFLRISL